MDALIKMFAVKIDKEEVARKMPFIIDNLVEQARKWDKAFNEAKCKIIHVGSDSPKNEYFMNDRKIDEAEEEKDLGVSVWISSNMKPGRQCSVAAKSANFALGQMLCAFRFRKKSQVIPL